MDKEKLTYEITPSVDLESAEIRLKVRGAAGRFYEEFIDTKNKAIREALIKLGWTPPAPACPHCGASAPEKPCEWRGEDAPCGAIPGEKG